MRCQGIDPVLIRSCGEISVDMNWRRLEVNVTHNRQLSYLSVGNYGPRHIAWRYMRRENAAEVSGTLEDIFLREDLLIEY